MRRFIEKIIYGDIKIEDITGCDFDDNPEFTEETAERIDDIIDREGLIIDVNPASVLASIVKAVQELCFIYKPEEDTPLVDFEFKFFKDDKERLIGALMTINDKDMTIRVGLDVPAVKTFDRSGGVAAYYAARRLSDGLEMNALDRALILMPKETHGEKLQILLEKNENLYPVYIDQDEAEMLIGSALNPDLNLSQLAYEISNLITGWNISSEF